MSAPSTGPVPLSEPLYGASFTEACTRFWKRFATFNGRASRSEFWWAQLMVALLIMIPSAILIVLTIVGANQVAQGGDPSVAISLLILLLTVLLVLIGLAIIVPQLALTWRRVEDAGFPGALALLTVMGLGIIPTVIAFLPTKPAGAGYSQQ